jgi:hypothetical protein
VTGTAISRLRGRAVAARHKAFVRGFSRLAPYYLVNEFPKSGGTWLAQMLADALELPFRRNTPIRFEKSVTHGHFLNPLGLANVVVLWRDPRDLLVSFYYHCYFVNEHANARLVAMMKASCPFNDYTDIRANLPAFIRFLSDTPVSPSFTWPEFARVWAGRPGTVQTSYEALRTDTATELSRLVEALTGQPLTLARAVEVADAHGFARAKAAAETTRPEDTEMSFVREGALGGWRTKFTPQAETMLAAKGHVVPMAQLGYVSK